MLVSLACLLFLNIPKWEQPTWVRDAIAQEKKMHFLALEGLVREDFNTNIVGKGSLQRYVFPTQTTKREKIEEHRQRLKALESINSYKTEWNYQVAEHQQALRQPELLPHQSHVYLGSLHDPTLNIKLKWHW